MIDFFRYLESGPKLLSTAQTWLNTRAVWTTAMTRTAPRGALRRFIAAYPEHLRLSERDGRPVVSLV